MQQRPQEPGDEPIVRALSTIRTAAYVLRDLDFDALDELDQGAIADWEASLLDARTALLGLLDLRGCSELERPPRGQLERWDDARVKHHVHGISKAIFAEFERVDAAPGALAQVSTSIVLGLLYSIRSIEQFILWQNPAARARARTPTPPTPAAFSWESAPAPAAWAPPTEPPAPAAPPAATASGGVLSWSPPAQRTPGLSWPSPTEPEPAPRVPWGSSPAPPAPAESSLFGESPPPAARPAAAVSFDWSADSAALPDLAPTTAYQPPAYQPPPAPAQPPPPRRRDVDLSAHDKRADVFGAVLRIAPVSVFHGCTRGPEFAKRERCLDATCAVAVPGGAAFALADGPEASLGARVAAWVAATTFCEALANFTSAEDLADARRAVLGAAESARRKLEALLKSLIESADDSDAMIRLRGSHPVQTVRKILEHTLEPDPGLRHVTPALAVALVGGVVLRTADDVHQVTLLSIGGSVVERKQRAQSPETLVPSGGPERFGPGAASPWQPAAVPVWGPVELAPGDILLAGSSTLGRGFEGSVFEKVALLSPELLQVSSTQDEHALQVLKQAEAAADRYEALEEKRAKARGTADAGRQRLFAGDLSLVLVTHGGRARTSSITPPAPSTSETVSAATREALEKISQLIKKPPGR